MLEKLKSGRNEVEVEQFQEGDTAKKTPRKNTSKTGKTSVVLLSICICILRLPGRRDQRAQTGMPRGLGRYITHNERALLSPSPSPLPVVDVLAVSWLLFSVSRAVPRSFHLSLPFTAACLLSSSTRHRRFLSWLAYDV